ncbi:rab-GTPase-TBC domain-containing protein, partial [Pterulicium gracile]
RNAYDQLFHSGIPLSKIRDAVIGDRLFSSSRDPAVFSVVGRSILWKLFLIRQGPLKTSTHDDPQSPLLAVRAARGSYRSLLVDKLRAPDGSLEDGFIVPGTTEPHRRHEDTPVNLEMNNPLSLHEDNPWRQWFTNVELRKTILQDVERTFPEVEYFRTLEVQHQLTNILFLYCVTHPDIGYRQGMHEILAPIYFAVDYDSIDEDPGTSNLETKELCSRLWVAADAWRLFESVMDGIGKWYEWREPPSTSGAQPLGNGNSSAQPGPIELKPYVAPIVHECNRIHSTQLRTVDPLLYQRLQSAGIEPQLYGIRWLRLMFTREFPLRDALILWDGIFASSLKFDTMPWICVSMLLRIRNELIPSDYTGQLTALLRYNAQPDGQHTPTTNPIFLLLQQALELQLAPTPATGANIVMQNRNLLSISVDVPESPVLSSRPSPAHRAKGSQSLPRRPSSQAQDSNHSRHRSFQTGGLPELFAKGLVERGESLGINKTLMNAVTELRRNLPDLASGLRSPPFSDGLTSYPLTQEGNLEDRPPGSPSMSSDGFHMRNRKLGESLSWVLDVLQADPVEQSPDQKRRPEALQALAYVRDILLDSDSHELDENRLF